MHVKLLTLSWHRPPLLQGSEKEEFVTNDFFVMADRDCSKHVQTLILTWFTVISVYLTLMASIAWLANALVATHCVMANGAIAAWVLHTFVDVNLTCLTLRDERGSLSKS